LNGSPLANSTSTHIASQTGVYEIIATDLLTGCSSNAIATVSAYGMIAGEAIVSEEFDSEQNITITVSGGSGEYLYQLNNGAIQQSNIFYNVPIGEHTIMVLDPFGCEPLLLKVYILKYPLFFTPNADGYNDYWNIITPSELQEVSIIIYDRYGKIIKNIRSNGAGWDGTLHGNRMPATDYWFTMRYRKDQIYREIKSHFSLKR
jgi:gliding motility-associated-like protein